MSEFPSTPSPTGPVSGTSRDTASAASSPPARAIATSPGEKRPEKPPLGFGGQFMVGFFGVLLPVLALLYELTTHGCAELFFDPIPSWWHVALIALVPLVNTATLLALAYERTRWLRLLAHLNAAALGIALIYALPLLPITPFAVIGIIFGLGLLALSPLLAFFTTLTARRALRRASPAEHPLPRPWWGFAAGALALLLPFSHDVLTGELLRGAMGNDTTQSRRAVQMLRWVGSQRALLNACYGRTLGGEAWREMMGTRRTAGQPDVEAQKVYYRVTGEPHNSVPAPASATTSGRGRGMWNFDANLGGQQVANRVPGLSMTGSRLDGKIEAAAGTSYTEWTLVFKNVARNASEARAQIELPPGGVVSRLTLWIDGEPREAAFGGRGQVRAAYQEVAVVQRRDPVLVTTAGPDRVLMQCFPVPPNGGEMKVRLGITAPLRLLDETRAELLLPRMLEVNFEQPGEFAHEVWMEADAPLDGAGTTQRVKLSEAELAPGKRLRAKLSAPAAESWTDDPTDPQMMIRQTVRRTEPSHPRRVVFVIDGSKQMAPELRGLAQALRKLPPDLECTLVFAGDEVETLGPLGDPDAGATWLEKRRATGGRDNLPALERAWDIAATEAGGAVVWLHGPQPVLLGSAEGLLQRTERERTPPLLYDLAVGAAPNRIVEKLDRFPGLRPMRLASSQPENLAQLLASWSGATPEYSYVRERVPRTFAPAETAASSKHIARLWGLEEIERLRTAPANLDQAIKLALSLQLVTPVSGAVVLERKEQYARHGLDPADPNSVPTVPEPTAALLAFLGGSALLLRRRR